MNSNSMNLIFDLIELIAGIYILYNGIRMKVTGKIEGNGLLGKNVDLFKARDTAGFIKAMYPVYIVCGTLFAIIGAVVAVLDFNAAASKSVQTYVTFALLILLTALAILTKRAQDKYLV